MYQMYQASSGSNMTRPRGPAPRLWAFVWLCGFECLRLRLNYGPLSNLSAHTLHLDDLLGQKNK